MISILKQKYTNILIVIAGMITVAYGVSAYVLSKASFEFVGFESLLNSIIKKEALTSKVKVINNTNLSTKVSRLKIEVYDLKNKRVLSFLPTNMQIKGDYTYLDLTFESGNVFELLADFLNEDYKNYKVTVKGYAFGVLPVYYKGNLNLDLEKK